MTQEINEDKHDFYVQSEALDSGLLLVKILNYGKHNENLFAESLCDRLVISCIRTVFGQKPLECSGNRYSKDSEN